MAFLRSRWRATPAASAAPSESGSGSAAFGVPVAEAPPGRPVHVSVAWDDRKGGGSFEVGEYCYVLPREEALRLTR